MTPDDFPRLLSPLDPRARGRALAAIAYLAAPGDLHSGDLADARRALDFALASAWEAAFPSRALDPSPAGRLVRRYRGLRSLYRLPAIARALAKSNDQSLSTETMRALVAELLPLALRSRELAEQAKARATPPPRRLSRRFVPPVGTCACCFRAFRLIDGLLPTHLADGVAAVRLGAQCRGSAAEPWDTSSLALERFLEALATEITAMRAELAALDAPHTLTVRVERRGSAILVSSGATEWPRVVASERRRLEQQLGHLQQLELDCRRRLATWRPKPSAGAKRASG